MDGLRKPPAKRPSYSRAVFPLPATPKTFSPPSLSPPSSKPTAPRSPKSHWLKKMFLLFLFVFLVVFAYVGFLGYKGLSTGDKMQFENKNSFSFLKQVKGLTASLLSDSRPRLKGEEDGRINILLLGRAGENYPGKNLTDTVMLMSVDTRNKKIALLSLPRDLYVPIEKSGYFTKLNSVYQYGLNNNQGVTPLEKTIETITGQSVHYFFTLDFDGFEHIINTLGGIQVEVPRDFYDSRYPGKNYSYEIFEIHKGWQTLDGSTALKYVRERHDDPEGDFGRAKRQQQVIQAAKDKAFSLGTVLNVFALNNLFDTLGENIKTDMSIEEMESFVELLKTLDTKNVTSLVVDAWQKESLLRVSHILVGSVNAFILVPRTGNWSEIQDLSQNIFHLDELKARQTRIAEEKPSIVFLLPHSEVTMRENLRKLTETLGFENTTFITLPSLTVSPEKSIIVDRTNLTKPYSLDELIRKFSLEKINTLPGNANVSSQSDFVIVVGTDLSETLSQEEQSLQQNSTEEPTYSEVLPPQPQSKKKH